MKLSDYFSDRDIVIDKKFSTLGYVDSDINDTLTYCDTLAYLEKASDNENISCLITRPDLSEKALPDHGVVVSENPRKTFYRLHLLLLEKKKYGLRLAYGIGDNCSIHPSASVSKRAKIGNNVTIAEKVIIKDGVSIDDNTYIDAGVVIGCEGLLFMKDGKNVKFIRHAGGVKIGKNVALLSQATIVRSVHPGFLTVIGDNTIIGISSNIGHDAQIGKNCSISSNCVIARKAKLGDGVWVGPSSTIREHANIGPNSQIKLGSVVIEDVKANESVSGNFAFNHPMHLRNFVKKKIDP
jgi:UDP-3-O-[3-hydroxymyristoyl] glucosamine N-acyltransferase